MSKLSLCTCTYTPRAHTHAHTRNSSEGRSFCLSPSQNSYVPSVCLPSVQKAFTSICQPDELGKSHKVCTNKDDTSILCGINLPRSFSFYPYPIPLQAGFKSHVLQFLFCWQLGPSPSGLCVLKPHSRHFSMIKYNRVCSPSMVLSTTKRAQCINVHF